VIGEGIGESEMEELVPEWGWRRDEGPGFSSMLPESKRKEEEMEDVYHAECDAHRLCLGMYGIVAV